MRNIKRVWLWLLLVIFSSILLKAQSIPALTGVYKSIPGNISAAGVASFSVSFTPGSSPVDSVSINVSPPSGAAKSFDSVSGFTITSPATASASVTAAWVDGAYTINYITLRDTSGRIIQYYRDGRILGIPALTGAPLAHTVNFTNIDFLVSGVQVVAPSITTQPSSTAVTVGNYFMLSIMAAGSSPISYQWKKDGINISGATGSNYAINSAAMLDAGNYTVVATNAAASVTSNAAVVTVTPAVMPSFLNQPTATTSALTAGGSLNISGIALGSATITYQWRKNGAVIPGATNSTYNINSVVPTDAGSYTLTATNSAGSVTSSAVVITVTTPILPSFTGPPSTMIGSTTALSTGESLYLIATASGSLPITYQWRKDGVAIAGATNTYYNKSPAVLTDAGAYTLTATNIAGSVTSNPTSITVVQATPPVITKQPASVTRNAGEGSGINFSVQVNGQTGMTPGITYFWKKDGVDISKSNPKFQPQGGNAITMMGGQAGGQPVTVEKSDAGSYTVVVSNQAGLSTESEPAKLTVNAANTPYFTENTPRTENVYSGNPLIIYFAPHAGAGAATDITREVLKNGVVVGEVNNSSYRITIATSSAQGAYTMRVTNAQGSATSPVVNITVSESPPLIGTFSYSVGVAPDSQYFNDSSVSNITLSEGSNLRLIYTFTGSLPMALKWYKDGSEIAPNQLGYLGSYISNQFPTAGFGTSVSSEYTKNKPLTPDSGEYYVVASNSFGSVTSRKVKVRVNPGSVSGSQSIIEGSYTAGSTIKISSTLTHDGTINSLGWKSSIPIGWTYQGGGGSEGNVKPKVNDTGNLEWAWSSLPASPITFTYSLKLPAILSTPPPGTSVSLQSTAVWQQNGIAGQIPISPDPLILSSVSAPVFIYHSADLDKNYIISLQELLRVIELYSFASGGLRSGEYSDGFGSTDGFFASRGRLSSYHSADSNKDGKLSLSELLRVIELYNYRANGSASRSGQYRMSAGSEDGFAPGP
jgi:hypothetical protein